MMHTLKYFFLLIVRESCVIAIKVDIINFMMAVLNSSDTQNFVQQFIKNTTFSYC